MRVANVHTWLKLNRVLNRLKVYFVLNPHLDSSLKDNLIDSVTKALLASDGANTETFMSSINKNIAAAQERIDNKKKADIAIVKGIDWTNYYKEKDKAHL